MADAGVEIGIEIVCGTRERQELRQCRVPLGTTVIEAIDSTDLQLVFPEIVMGETPVGIFGRRVEPGAVLADGDRIEIYRPLTLDPREARRRRANKGAG